jgi:DME family drug/metabolite transporter
LTPNDSTRSSPSKAHPLRGYFYIAGATFCWGVSAALGRAVFTGRLLPGAASDIGPLILSQARTTIALLVLAPILLLRRGAAGLTVPRMDFGRALFIGVCGVAASNYFYYLAIQKTNVATAIILQYTAPIWVLLYMVGRRLQRATLQRIASVFLAVVGSALVIGIIGPGKFRISTLGVVAGQLAALSFACYNIAIPGMLARHDRWKTLLYILIGASLFWAVVNPPWRIVAAHYTAQQWLFLSVFAVISVLLPFALYISGLQYLDATRAVVTSCLEPVFSIVITAISLGEAVTGLQGVGIVIVLAASVLVQLPSRREREAPAPIELME